MRYTTRPSTHDERDSCIAAVEGLAPAQIDPLLARLVEAWATARDGYLAARQARVAALSAVAVAIAAAGAADTEVERCLSRWVRTVVDGMNRPRTRELTAMLGGVLPSEVLERQRREVATRVRLLLEHVALRPELAGDTDDLAALTAATERLEACADAAEAAARARTAATADLNRASAAFDAGWGQLVRGLKLVDPDGARVVVPRFARGGRRAAPAAPSPEPGSEPLR